MVSRVLLERLFDCRAAAGRIGRARHWRHCARLRVLRLLQFNLVAPAHDPAAGDLGEVLLFCASSPLLCGAWLLILIDLRNSSDSASRCTRSWRWCTDPIGGGGTGSKSRFRQRLGRSVFHCNSSAGCGCGSVRCLKRAAIARSADDRSVASTPHLRSLGTGCWSMQPLTSARTDTVQPVAGAGAGVSARVLSCACLHAVRAHGRWHRHRITGRRRRRLARVAMSPRLTLASRWSRVSTS